MSDLRGTFALHFQSGTARINNPPGFFGDGQLQDYHQERLLQKYITFDENRLFFSHQVQNYSKILRLFEFQALMAKSTVFLH
ncbi:hypothetical protein J2TS4_03140 [Paenibacillus sp. J2TS4]|nr:hypothetical protein J2TS4_03140 [Paenibacillus sp. J2TS4]